MQPDVARSDASRRFAEALRRLRRTALRSSAASAVMQAAMAWLVCMLGAWAWRRVSPAPPDTRTVALVSSLITLATAALSASRALASTKADSLARLVEHCAPESRNVVITAVDMAHGRVSANEVLAARIFDHAADITRLVAARPLLTNRRIAAAGAVSCAACLSTLMLASVGDATRAAPPSVADADEPASVAPQLGMSVRLLPPAYTRRPELQLVDPVRLDIVEGTRLIIEAAPGSHVLAASYAGDDLSPASADRRLVAAAPSEDGVLQVTLGALSVRDARTIPVTVHADPLPLVTIERPGKDLLVGANAAPIEVRVTARDDLLLSALRLRFTKVSGSGEQFEFIDGDVPLALSPMSPTEWTARAHLDLSALQLAPGDLVAYRAAARDGRPSRAEGESDTYVIRVVQPGDVASAGFAIDDDENKFALSQQMLLVKTERLHAVRATLPAEEYAQRSSGLAVEQRMIRNEFSFMVGGEVEDEEEEAAHSHELQEGRDANRGRREVLNAIRAMSRAEQWLLRAATTEALPNIRDAVAALQLAFSRTRYLLRTLPQRARIDLDRRLSGDTTGVSGWERTPATARVGLSPDVLLRFIAAIADATRLPSTADAATDLQQIARDVVVAAPADTSMGEASRLLLEASRSGDREARVATLGRAAAILSARAGVGAAPPLPIDAPSLRPLRGAVARSASMAAQGRRP